MSDLVYPNNIQGLTFNVIREPIWNASLQRSATGKATAVQYYQYPLTKFTLNYELLRDDLTVSDLRALVGLFNAVGGMFDTFLFQDPDFNTVANQNFGIGTGTQTLFPITAVFENAGGPGAAELIQNFNGSPQLYSNTSLISPSTYTLGPSISPLVDIGFVLFNTAPADGVNLNWSGQFYYRCRFNKNSYPWAKFMYKWWAIKTIDFTSVLL